MKFQVNLGISLAALNNPAEVLAGFSPDAYFREMELSANAVQDFKALKISRKWERIYLRDLLPKSLTQGVAEQGEKLCEGFLAQMELFTETASEAKAAGFSMDFGLDELLTKPELAPAKIKLIKRLLPLLFRNNLELGMPLRVPFSEPDMPRMYGQCLEKLADMRYGIVAEVHPHELGPDFEPEKLLRWLRFDLMQIHLIYEPDIGNHLVMKAVKPWLEYLDMITFTGPVMFCPKISDAEGFQEEVEKLRDLLTEIEKSEN